LVGAGDLRPPRNQRIRATPGQRTRRFVCGPWRLEVREGYYSASPGGLNGIFSFPALTVYAGRRKPLEVQLDAGEATVDRSEYGDSGGCPRTLILSACAELHREAGDDCATGAKGKARYFVHRLWFDDERREHRRVDEWR
jgi:hypothetical protein